MAVAVPRTGGTLHEQAQDALKTIEAVHDEESTRGSIVHQAVFVARPDLIPECRAIIKDFYGPGLPATSYVIQPPCEGKLLAIEALGVGQGKGEVEIERLSDQVVRVSHRALSWVHCANVTPRDGVTGVYNQTISSLSRMRAMLAKLHVDFDRIIRTWIYLGGIVADEQGTQRYKELNRARSAFFEGVQFLAGCQPEVPQGFEPYPASTGIGTEGRDLMMSCIALATQRPDIVAMPLENPRQTAAFQYASSYSPKSPKFARALALSCGSYATIFISGTASIVNSESRHVGDVDGQTHQTLDNIEALISEENLRRHGLPGLGSSLDNLGLVRIYIKRQEDYERARAICRSRLGNVPTVYAVADVCRPELLVEIEGMAFSRRDALG
jgi:enamine deaminase RidA (YjgF/YER057c/UK114 family)